MSQQKNVQKLEGFLSGKRVEVSGMGRFDTLRVSIQGQNGFAKVQKKKNKERVEFPVVNMSTL